MKTFKESIIDIPRKTYATGVFDKADTKDPIIKPSVKALIDKQLEMFEKEYPVVKVGLIGSILTKRYRADADLDLNVLFDVPVEKREEERTRLSKKYLSASNPDNIQGKLIPGTKHPINYYFITDMKTYNDQEKKADAVFDIEDNKFIKRPEDFTFDKSMYLKDFDRKVQEIDVVKGELKRDIIDYRELEELTPDDVLNLQELINEKLEEIEQSLQDIIKIGDGVDADRRAAFDKDMSPDEIRKYGVKNRLPKNVVYKMLEKYHYLKFYKKCKKVLEDGKVSDKEIDDLEMHEAKGKSIAFAFGRFNPPTIGHEKLINKVKSVPANDYKIFLSRSNDPKKNPLSPRDKLSIMKKMFPSHARNIEINQTNMVLDIATVLYKKGYTDVTMVAGSDRVREFETILKKYNGVSSRHGMYDFENIKVVSAGERDPDAEGATGMSASKMRAAAAKGDLNNFKKGLPRGVDADSIMKQVRKGMNLAANYMYIRNMKPIASLEQFEQQQIRDLYIREQIFNIGDTVDYIKEDLQGKVVRKGTNYIVVEDNKNNLHKAWIWDCIPVSTTNREAEMREHNLNIDYGFEAVSEKVDKEADEMFKKLSQRAQTYVNDLLRTGVGTREAIAKAKSKFNEDMDAQPQDKDVKKKDGTQPKKYYKDLKKDTKDKRADHFKNRDTTKNDNRPAPGDKGAKTKPSIHTTKFKKMYGEVYEIGTPEYTKHTIDMTPGQENPIKKVKGFLDREKEKPSEKDIKEWASTESTMNKYRERFKEQWKAKLSEVVAKMIEKL